LTLGTKTVFMFSGQGSQYYQMARPLFEQNTVFRDCMLRMDASVRSLCGISVLDHLYSPANAKGAVFDRLALTHPAIFMVEYSLAEALIAAGIAPDVTLGASLGSFAAATTAGHIGADEALELVVRHAAVIEKHCRPGAMLAILGPPALYQEDFMRTRSELAAVNFDTHFVVSACQESCAEIEDQLRRRSVTFQRLPVGFAFHSRWIEEAREPLLAIGSRLPRRAGALPMMCCEQAQAPSELSDAYFWNVARRRIRFRETVETLERDGLHRYVDTGPGGTLATFLKYTLPPSAQSRIHSVLTPYGRDRENFAALVSRG
jgi:bacillaene synthase trans-acting acyltransferase